jgi:hypothetical protein
MESNFIIIKISAEMYSGFTYKIPKAIFNIMTPKEIIKETKTYMKNFFQTHDLYLLKDGVDALELHFHDDIPFDGDLIYLCDHCH